MLRLLPGINLEEYLANIYIAILFISQMYMRKKF